MKVYLFILIVSICFMHGSFAQDADGVVSFNLPIRNSLTFNRYALNPTFSFVREQTRFINITNKREWVQFEDAPETYLASYSGRFAENIGAGIGLFQQNYGVLTTFGGVLNFAYNAKLARDTNLTFGLNIGAYQSGVNTSNVVTNFVDPALQNVPNNFLLTVNPGINFGMEFLDFGLSVNNLALYNFESSSLIEDNRDQSFQLHAMYTGYMASRGFFDEAKFSTLIRSEFFKEETIISGLVMVTVPKGIWAQAGYNSVFGMSGGLGLNITEQIAIEYNFETAVGTLGNFGPSHEITLAYRFKPDRNLDYSNDDDMAGLLSGSNRGRKRTTTSNRTKNKSNVSLSNEERAEQARLAREERNARKLALEQQAKEEEEAKRLATQKAQEEAAKQAEVSAEQKAKADAEAEAKRLAEQKAQEEVAKQAQVLAEQKAKDAAEAEAKRLAEQKAQEEAAKQAQVLAEQKAKEAAEAEAKRLAEQKAQEEAAKQAQVLAEQKAKALAEAEALRLVEEKAQEETAQQAQVLAEQKAKEAAEAEAKAAAEVEALRLAEQKAQEESDQKANEVAEVQSDMELINNPKDERAKAMLAITQQAEASLTSQKALLQQLDSLVLVKDTDLKALKEENDLSEQGIAVQPRPFKSITAENNRLKAIKSDLETIIKERSEKIKDLEALYEETIVGDTLTNDVVLLHYKKEIKRLKSEQLKASQTKTQLDVELERIRVATEFEKRRRIKRASFDTDEKRYLQDRATLKNIKETTSLSDTVLTREDFDFGEDQGNNIKILKNINNVDNGYYMIIAVHSNVDERNDFLTKVVASGRKDVDFFYDVNTSKYYIYYEKYRDISEATKALDAKGDRPYNSKMSIVKIEN
jgi:type IX secretion system PorP/SprF family membrane protein